MEMLDDRRGQLVILDAFCGVAGNTIAFARCAGVHVIAYDNDKARLELARHNADVYGVRHSVDFVCDDVVAAMTTAVVGSQRRDTLIDMIFLSPPWGGPEYIDADNFDLRGNLVSGLDLIDLMKLALAVTPNVACFLPRNTDVQPLVDALSPGAPRFEIEKNHLNGKLKAISLYFGALPRLNDSK
jgi:trimethylguanosine synthase